MPALQPGRTGPAAAIAILALMLLGACSTTLSPSGPSGGARTASPPSKSPGASPGLAAVCERLADSQDRILGEPELAQAGSLSRADRADLARRLDRVADLGRGALRQLDGVTPRPRGYRAFRARFYTAHVTGPTVLAHTLRTSADASEVQFVAYDLQHAADEAAVEARDINVVACGDGVAVPGLPFPPIEPAPSVQQPAGDDDTGGGWLPSPGLLLFVGVGVLIGYLTRWLKIGLTLLAVGIGALVVVLASAGAIFANVVDETADCADCDPISSIFVGLGGVFAGIVVVGALIGLALLVTTVSFGIVIGAAVRRWRDRSAAPSPVEAPPAPIPDAGARPDAPT